MKAQGKIRRVAPEVVASLVLHALILGGLFVLPGLASRDRALTQKSHLHEVQAAQEALDPPPPPPEDRPPEPEPPPEFNLEKEVPPEEPPVFLEDDPDYDDLDDAMPPLDVPRSMNPRPGSPVIGVGGGAAGSGGSAGPPAPPAPKPEPKPTRPVIVKKVSPDYPRRAREREIQGSVVLQIEVLPDGTVGEIEVRESSGFGILDRAAMDAVRKWHFKPAEVQGQPVRSYVVQRVSFELQ